MSAQAMPKRCSKKKEEKVTRKLIYNINVCVYVWKIQRERAMEINEKISPTQYLVFVNS